MSKQKSMGLRSLFFLTKNRWILPILLSAPFVSQAAGIDISSTKNFVDVLSKVANFMFDTLLSLSVIMVLVGAYMYVTAGGDSEKVGKATKTLTFAAVGVVVALIAKTFPGFVASVFGGSAGGGGGGASGAAGGYTTGIGGAGGY